jgi:hypothetical protein
VLSQDRLGAAGDLQIDPGRVETHRHRRGAPGSSEQEHVCPWRSARPARRSAERTPGTLAADHLAELGLAHRARLIVGPRRLELRLETEPLVHVELALVDARFTSSRMASMRRPRSWSDAMSSQALDVRGP